MQHEIILSFVDDGQGHFDDIAVIDRANIPAATLSAFLRYLSDEIATGEVIVSVAS